MLSRRRFCLSTVAFAAAGTPSAWAAKKGRNASDHGRGSPRKSALPAQAGHAADGLASRIAWLDEHTDELSSIDLEDDDFDDLEGLEEAIGDARIVMLGEPTSGDGAALRAKSRLVRFLHEQMDFNVLAFESGLYDMRKVWARMRAGESARTAARRGLSPVWSQSEEVQLLIDYVGDRARRRAPLELAGFDCRFSASPSRDRMADDLAAFLAEEGIETASVPQWDQFRSLVERIADGASLPYWKPSADEEQLIAATIDSVVERLPGPEETEPAFWRQVLKSTNALTKLRAQWDPQSPTAADLNLLNASMADNLIWLAREAYPECKIIVWAATARNLHNPHLLDPASGITTMGHHAWQALGETVYSLAVTAYAGERRVGEETEQLAPPPAESLEGLWGATEDEIAFLDLRRIPEGGEWLAAPLQSLILGGEPATADWTKVLDGVLFLRTMEPATIEE